MEKAIEYVKQAVEADQAQDYPRALELYTAALEYFKTHLKYEKNPRAKEAIQAKVLPASQHSAVYGWGASCAAQREPARCRWCSPRCGRGEGRCHSTADPALRAMHPLACGAVQGVP